LLQADRVQRIMIFTSRLSAEVTFSSILDSQRLARQAAWKCRYTVKRAEKEAGVR
jgi:hypothetical protein